MLVDGADPYFNGCAFQRNHSAGDGGAVASYGGPNYGLFYNCFFQYNRAVTRGGAVSLSFAVADTITFARCEFSADSAAYGGAVYSAGVCRPLLDGCLLDNNNATSGGGAIYRDTFEDEGGNLTIHECELDANTAPQGCGIYFNGGTGGTTCHVLYCTLYGNARSGASLNPGTVYATSDALVSIENTIISNSVNAKAVQCAGSSVVMTCCDLWDNQSGNWLSCISGQANVRGNITSDPLYCYPPDDLSLRSDSPCLPGNNQDGCLMGRWENAGCSPRTPAGQLTVGSRVGARVPSPTRAPVRIAYTLGSSRAPAHALVIDASGRRVADLLSLATAAGAGTIDWDGNDVFGRPVPQGVYFIRVVHGGRVATTRMVLLR